MDVHVGWSTGGIGNINTHKYTSAKCLINGFFNVLHLSLLSQSPGEVVVPVPPGKYFLNFILNHPASIHEHPNADVEMSGGAVHEASGVPFTSLKMCNEH